MTQAQRDARTIADAFVAATAKAKLFDREVREMAAALIEADASMREFCAATAFAAYLRNPANFK